MNSKCGVQSKRKCGSHESCVCIVGFPACGCQKKSVVYEMECRHAAIQRGKQDSTYVYCSQGSQVWFVREGVRFALMFARQSSLLCCSQGSQVCFVVRKAVKFALLFARK